jgi:hypothetical protein
MSKEKWKTDFEDAIKGAVASGTKVVGVGPGGGTITVEAGGQMDISGDLSEIEISKPPLEEAIEIALLALEEIRLYSMYNRPAQVEEEAKNALDKLKELKQKWDEQNLIMDTLSKPAEEMQ